MYRLSVFDYFARKIGRARFRSEIAKVLGFWRKSDPILMQTNKEEFSEVLKFG